MRIKYERVVVPLLLLLMSGCYQQASESFQPANQTDVPVNLPGATGDIQDLTVFPATATLPPITIIAPTRQLIFTPEAQTDDPTPEAPTLELPTSDAALLPEVTQAADTQPTQATFITPFAPLGPVTPILPVPTTTLRSPTTTPSGLVTPTAFVEGGGECTYSVRSGDNLFRIATNHNVTLAEMRAANPQISGDLLQPGQILQIPGCTPGSSPDSSVPGPDTPAGDPPTSDVPIGTTTYTVQTGDTLFTIARQFNTTVAAIVEANNMTDPDRLSVGQELIIPAPAS